MFMILVLIMMILKLILGKKNNMIYKCLGLLKKRFLLGLMGLKSLTTNKECNVRPEVVNVMSLYFIFLVLKQVNVVVVVTISMIHLEKNDVLKNLNVKVSI